MTKASFTPNNHSIKEVDLKKVAELTFVLRFVGCIVMTHDGKFLLQRVVDARPFFPMGSIITFGGRIESRETTMQALVRELHEELGADVEVADLVSLGAITEDVTNHTELIHAYFWRDLYNTITGCYEDTAVYFDDIDAVFAEPKVTDDVRWMLKQCQQLEIIK
jgi:8-oxo-dGTP pyrophosphatase MutT (NUDIX family)